jgi:hypothetical protein
MCTQLLGHSVKHDLMMLGSVKHDPMMLGLVTQQCWAQMDTQLLGPFAKHDPMMLGPDGYLALRSFCQDPSLLSVALP